MKNYVQDGEVLTLAAPADVLSGAGLIVGDLFGAANADALSGASVATQMQGVVTLAKATSQAWAVGDRIYWDNSAKKATTVASGNRRIGTCTTAALSADTTGDVLLGNIMPAQLTATATLDFASIATTASADLTITVTGAAVGDAVAIGLPAAPAAGLVFFGFVSAADTVTIRAMNITGTGVDAASGTYRATVFKT